MKKITLQYQGWNIQKNIRIRCRKGYIKKYQSCIYWWLNYTNPFIEKWQADRTGVITTINAVIGGTRINYGSLRLYDDVLIKKPQELNGWLWIAIILLWKKS